MSALEMIYFVIYLLRPPGVR